MTFFNLFRPVMNFLTQYTYLYILGEWLIGFSVLTIRQMSCCSKLLSLVSGAYLIQGRIPAGQTSQGFCQTKK